MPWAFTTSKGVLDRLINEGVYIQRGFTKKRHKKSFGNKLTKRPWRPWWRMFCRKVTLNKDFDLRSTWKTCYCIFLFEMQCGVRMLVSLYGNPKWADEGIGGLTYGLANNRNSLYRYWWNTRISPLTKKWYLHRAQWIKILSFSFTCEDIGVVIVTKMINQ